MYQYKTKAKLKLELEWQLEEMCVKRFSDCQKNTASDKKCLSLEGEKPGENASGRKVNPERNGSSIPHGRAWGRCRM